MAGGECAPASGDGGVGARSAGTARGRSAPFPGLLLGGRVAGGGERCTSRMSARMSASPSSSPVSSDPRDDRCLARLRALRESTGWGVGGAGTGAALGDVERLRTIPVGRLAKCLPLLLGQTWGLPWRFMAKTDQQEGHSSLLSWVRNARNPGALAVRHSRRWAARCCRIAPGGALPPVPATTPHGQRNGAVGRAMAAAASVSCPLLPSGRGGLVALRVLLPAGARGFCAGAPDPWGRKLPWP